MATKKKMLQAAAGNAGGAGLNVEDVFSTYLYEGNGSTQTITNGIDLDGEGGLTWLKMRDTSSYTARQYHFLYDTERGSGKRLSTNLTDAEAAFEAQELNSFNSNGFSLGSSFRINEPSKNYASWTFRKAPKFFDVVTYTGTGSAQTIAHNLGVAPGFYVVKATSQGGNWTAYHSTTGTERLRLNTTGAKDEVGFWATPPTSTDFYVSNPDVNSIGVTYVAYLFAHNDGDGEFGPDGDADIIKCGSFPWGSTSGTEVNLGFEPQWILFKAADQAGKNWFIFDAMRGIVTGGLSGDGDAALFPNTSGAENVNTWGVDLTPTGFIAYGNNIASSGNIIYMAIRRGTKVPESATEVFDLSFQAAANPSFNSGFVVDMATRRNISVADSTNIQSRLTGNKRMSTNATSSETGRSDYVWDYMDGWHEGSADANTLSWMWKRAPGFFDVVAHSGNATNNHAIQHNLGVAPEMIWTKCRSSSKDWGTYVLGDQGFLNTTNSLENLGRGYSLTLDPTATHFYLNTTDTTNDTGETYISYLFASLDGVSKVGSVSHTIGTDTNVDCGFSSGARFILLKRTDGASSWYVFDTVRGIISGDDKGLYLQSTLAEQTGDWIDPLSSGFTMVGGSFDTGDYIFYAIA
jgi:hypothetical protein